MPCRVSLAGIDDSFHILALLIFNFQRATIGGLQFDLQFPISPVELGIGGMVGNAVLVANVGGDLLKQARQLAFETRKIGSPAGELRQSFHLIVILQPANAPAERVMAYAGGVDILPPLPSNADGIDRDVFGGLDLLDRLVPGELAEGVGSGGNQDDVLLPFEAIDAVEGI